MSDQFPYNFGKYRVEAEIGRGGFGTVFRAIDGALERPVAIKILDPLYMRDQRWVARFRREARLMAQLEHPNIVPIHEIDEHDGRLFLAMRLIDGPDLTNIIAEKGPLSWDDTVDIVSQIASAIDFAHQQNVIHRDLKPSNIMVTSKQAVLTDFGLAQIVESNAQSISISGGFTGTYNYMPPEIFNNDTITSAVDIYALGCVLFEMVTGHMLFEGQSTGAIIGAHLKGVTLDQPLPEGTPPGLREVILTALAKDPFNRYATAGELVNELKRLSSDLLAKPYAALELAMSEERWEDALAITAEIRAQDPDYRDSAAIEERALAENEAAQRRQMAGQLETTALVALAAGNFDEVRGVLLQWRHVAPDDPQLGVIDGELQMAEQYAQVEEHIANEDWTKAELAAAVIISQYPDYRNIGSLKEKITTQLHPQPGKDVRQSHPEEVAAEVTVTGKFLDQEVVKEPTKPESAPAPPPSKSPNWFLIIAAAAGIIIVLLAIIYFVTNIIGGSNGDELPVVVTTPEDPTPTMEASEEVTIKAEETPEVAIKVEEPPTSEEAAVTPEVEVSPEDTVPVFENEYEEEWYFSAHNDNTAEAFIHWNEDNPREVPTACAKCHSSPGFQDFIGADGSEPGVVDLPAPIGTTIDCDACHNDVTENMTSVVFPSGIEIHDLGDESTCMNCHQGRHSTVSVNAGIEEAGLSDSVDADTVSEDLGFSNIHYYAAAATQLGTLAKGGYEYDGKSYDSRFAHVEGYETCTTCHDSHTLEVNFDDCTQCHEGLNSTEDLSTIRMAGSLVDFNGNGDIEEGIEAEIFGLRDMLYESIQTYANEVIGTPIVYDSLSYPYFFIDSNANGTTEEDEIINTNQYNAWTPRLAKATYNYQVSQKDPGNFAHGAKYTIQLLYDSIEDLNEAISRPVDLSNAHRIDHGHFAGSEEAFRHWDEDGAVPGNCSKCHSAAGLPLFMKEGVTIEQPLANGFKCATCHDNVETFSRYVSESVTFPSGLTVSLAEDSGDSIGLESNLCINCHQGRNSKSSMDSATAGIPDDEIFDSFFPNIHYFAAGASLLGTEAQGGYEYDGRDYVGRYEHVQGFDTCLECHDPHTQDIKIEDCGECHEVADTIEGVRNIRVSETDFDGDGDVEEGILGEIETMRVALLLAMQDYAFSVGADPIGYHVNNYPYFFIDTNADGRIDEEEANIGNRYSLWTPRLLRAAYNYQFATKDPGAYTHNPFYIIQILQDSLQDIGADISALTRP